MDLYVKQVAGGQPIRLTFDGAGNTTPDFSPDGSKDRFPVESGWRRHLRDSCIWRSGPG